LVIDPRTALAVLLTLAFTYLGLGRDLPFDTTALIPFTASLLTFIGYLYLLRTLVRLPFALVITFRRARVARRKHGLNRADSLRDGFARGFLDTRRWTVAPLATVDRLAVLAITLLSTTPYLGLFLVRLAGLLGIALLLLLYLFRGTFTFLVDDGLSRNNLQRNLSFPFFDSRD
jgi:hypothetical protein